MFELVASCIAEFYFRCLSSYLGLVKLSHVPTLGDITQVFRAKAIYYLLVDQSYNTQRNIL